MGSLSEEVRTEVLCGHICDLEAENAKLREQGARLFDKTLELGTENAKLRELVRNLLRVIPRDVSGVVIGAHGEHPTYYSFADAMRELGVGE